MPGETGETPAEVVTQPAQLKRESVFTRLKNRLLGRPPQPLPQGEGLVGTRTTAQIEQAAQQIPSAPEKTQERVPAPGDPDYEPLTKESSMPEWVRRAQLEAAAQQIRASQTESTGITQQPLKTPDQLAEEARIDAENLAKLQQPSQPTEQQPKVAPFITETPQTTILPEKVFEPQPEVSGEHTGVDEFLKTKQPTTEAPAQPSETAAQTPTGEAIPLQSQPQEEQPIPVRIPQEEEVPT